MEVAVSLLRHIEDIDMYILDGGSSWKFAVKLLSRVEGIDIYRVY